MRARTILFVVLAAAQTAAADEVVLQPMQDATLIESGSGALGNGSGPAFFAGRTGQTTGSIRRGLIAFDIAGAVPMGATITSVRLTLTSSPASGGEATISLHRVLAEWGEGPSSASGGGGAPAEDGDATWRHTFYPIGMWSTRGGDFDAAPHGGAIVDQPAAYTWESTQEMVADAQSWLEHPTTNFGWILIGDEMFSQTVKRFDSREGEDEAARPTLTVDFEPLCVPEPVGAGYWHRQCAVPSGAFEVVSDCADRTLERLGFEKDACDGIVVDPPGDVCEMALRKLTSVDFNLCADRLQTSCEVIPSVDGCVSSRVGDLIDEMADLIHAGECRRAMRCAGGLD